MSLFTEVEYALEEAEYLANSTMIRHYIGAEGEGFVVLPEDEARRNRVAPLEIISPSFTEYME
jgi:hypothetical protein